MGVGGGGHTGQPDKVWSKKTILHLEQRQDLDEVQGPPAFLIRSIRGRPGGVWEDIWTVHTVGDQQKTDMSVQDRA